MVEYNLGQISYQWQISNTGFILAYKIWGQFVIDDERRHYFERLRILKIGSLD